MTNLIALSGFAQVGKDTAAGFLAEVGYQRLAFADILRQSLYNLNPIVAMPLADAPNHWARVKDLVDWKGWDVVKVEYPEIRALLQRFGTEVGRELYGETFWIDRVMSQISTPGKYVITDARFPNEHEAVHNAGGQIWRIQRQGVGAVNNHVSEQVLPYDTLVENDGDLDAFRASVLSAVGLSVD